jgi:hypothetical protein
MLVTVLHFCSGQPPQNLSGVDNRELLVMSLDPRPPKQSSISAHPQIRYFDELIPLTYQWGRETRPATQVRRTRFGENFF